jgi:hypothetical protein
VLINTVHVELAFPLFHHCSLAAAFCFILHMRPPILLLCPLLHAVALTLLTFVEDVRTFYFIHQLDGSISSPTGECDVNPLLCMWKQFCLIFMVVMTVDAAEFWQFLHVPFTWVRLRMSDGCKSHTLKPWCYSCYRHDGNLSERFTFDFITLMK